MPRKPKLEKKTITVMVNSTLIAITLHPPTGTRKSWYAYWNGLVASRSTGQQKLEDAIVVAKDMLERWKVGSSGARATPFDTLLSDVEFEAIQKAHFGRLTDPAAKVRADKSLTVCLEAIRAFKVLTGLERIVLATPDDCARFQREALTRPKNWRQSYPRGKKAEEVERISPNTVLKWTRSLQAAFQRANRNAGRKCVRVCSIN